MHFLLAFLRNLSYVTIIFLKLSVFDNHPRFEATMKHIVIVSFLLCCLVSASSVYAESIYELRKLTEDEWLAMSTEERLTALATSYQHEENQTFLGKFGRYHDLYQTWGYEAYEMEDRYENYSFRNFESYNIIEERRKKWSYNQFGDRIAKMRHSANMWREIYSGTATTYTYIPFNYINSIGENTGYVDGVWVARESTEDWAVSITGAGSIRTMFTPLTLSLPNVDGVSMDFQTSNTAIKLITSAYVGQTGNDGGTDTSLYRTGGVMLRGGRIKHKFGILTLGATYATAYGVQGNRQRGGEWRGTVTTDTPTPVMVAVRFLDDSPADNEGGPVVYNIRLKVNGKYRDDIIPQVIKDDVGRDRTTAVSNTLELGYIEPKSAVGIRPPDYDYLSIQENILKYLDYSYMNNIQKGNNLEATSTKYDRDLGNSYYSVLESNGKPVSADGTEALVYIFDLMSIAETLYQVEAVTTVANDYRIQTAMIYTTEQSGGHDSAGKEVSWYSSTYWQTVAQCEGNIKDKSNVRTVTFDFGFQVATVTYGFDMDLNYYGFKVKGEWVNNTTGNMFAEGNAGAGAQGQVINNQEPRNGHRYYQHDNAYYVTLDKQWEKFGFSGEVFKMGKFYRPYFDYYYPEGGGWRYAINTRNSIARVPLVEDNDDGDVYPDTMLVRRTWGYNIYDSEDPDGVFPGNDQDNDGLPDNNRNNNGEPDYNEPFMMFDVDPDQFVFGNDYNNNTIPDFREDDMKMDLPYDLDRQGHHFFLRYSPLSNLSIIGGSFKTKGVALDNRTYNDYVKGIFDYNVFGIGKLYAEYRYERIQDNIRDVYIQVNQSMKDKYLEPGITASTGRYTRDLYYDELEYRNSNVNRLFLESKIRAVPAITLENHVKFERNDQIEGNMYDTTYQPHDVLSTMAMVNKIVYTKRWGDFEFSPGIKFRLYKKVRSESLQPLDHYLLRIPMVMFKYYVSPLTDITLGIQGMGAFPMSYVDYVQSQNDYDQENIILQVQNRSAYFGYNVWGAIGVSYEKIGYKETVREYESYKTSSMFVKMSLGW